MASIVEIVIKGIDKTKDGFTGPINNLKELEKRVDQVKPFFVALAALAEGAFTTMIEHQIKLSDEMGKFAQKSGTATEFLSTFARTAELSDVDMQGLQKAMVDFSKSIVANDPAFASLAIHVKDAQQQLKPTEVLLYETADAFERMADGATKTKLATELFGKKGAEMIPLLNQGSAAIKEQQAQLDRWGLTITKETSVAAEEFNDNLKKLELMALGVANTVAKELVPSLADWTTGMVRWIDENGLVQAAGATLAETVQKLAIGFVTLYNLAKMDSDILANGLAVAFNNVLVTVETLQKYWDNLTTGMQKTGKAAADLVEAQLRILSANEKLLHADLKGSWAEASKALDLYKTGLLGLASAAAGEVAGNFNVSAEGASKLWTGLKFFADETSADLTKDMNSFADTVMGILNRVAAKKKEIEKPTAPNVLISSEIMPPETPGGQSMAAFKLSGTMELDMKNTQAEMMALEGNSMDALIQKNSALQLAEQQRFQARMIEISSITQAEGENLELISTAYTEHFQKIAALQQKMAQQTKLVFATNADAMATAFGNFAELANTIGKKNSGLFKALMYMQAVASTAAGVARALADYPWPYSIIAGSAVAAAGAAQIATVAALQTPAAHGGLDYVPAETTYLLDRGERVVSPKQNEDLTDFLAGDRSGYGGEMVIQNQIFLDGSKLGEQLNRLSRDGRLIISSRAIVP